MNISRAFPCALAAVGRFTQTHPVTVSSVLGARMITEEIHTGRMNTVATERTYSVEEQ